MYDEDDTDKTIGQYSQTRIQEHTETYHTTCAPANTTTEANPPTAPDTDIYPPPPSQPTAAGGQNVLLQVQGNLPTKWIRIQSVRHCGDCLYRHNLTSRDI